MTREFDTSFTATELAARGAIESISDHLRASWLTRNKADEVEIALVEAVNNVVEHAFVDGEIGDVQVSCRLTDARLDINICDTGRPLPDHQLPPGLAKDLNVARRDLPEGGYGWFLIRELTSDICYDRRGRENHLLLRFDL